MSARALIARWLAALAVAAFASAPVFAYAHALSHVEERLYGTPFEGEPPHACELCVLGVATDSAANSAPALLELVAHAARRTLEPHHSAPARAPMRPFSARAPPARA